MAADLLRRKCPGILKDIQAEGICFNRAMRCEITVDKSCSYSHWISLGSLYRGLRLSIICGSHQGWCRVVDQSEPQSKSKQAPGVGLHSRLVSGF